ncbi:hypothetical protein [Nocardioides zeae]
MPQMKHPNGDVRVIPVALVEQYESKGWEVTDVRVAEVIATLKGADLDKALTEAGLPKGGTVAQKRARLAEHVQQQPATGGNPKEQA